MARVLRFSLPIALLLVAAIPAAGAEQVAAERRFGDRLEVVELELAVQVLARSGEPVRGLGVEAFRVLDEGKPRRIVDFDVVDLATIEPEATGLWPRELPLASRRHLLFLFDLSFSTPASLLRARLAARDFVLGSLHPADLAAVATFSVEFGPRMVMSFTPDRAQLARAIDTLSLQEEPMRRATVDPLHFMLSPLAGASSGGTRRGSEASELRESLESVESEVMEHIASYAERVEKQYERARVSAMTRGLAQLARALDSVAGRKQVVLFSEGFDSRLLLGRQPTGAEEEQTESLDINSGRLWLVDNDNRFGNTGLQSDVERMLESFRRADCAIQAVDIGGLRAGSDAGNRRASPGQDTLFLFANETGGSLFKDSNDFGAQLGRVAARSSHSYVLTVALDGVKPDGRFRRLKVEVEAPPGATLSYRRGYYAPRPFAELPALERTLLAADAIVAARPRDEIDVALLASAFRTGQPRAYVPVVLEAGASDLLGGERPSRLEIYVYVSDQRGEMLDYFSRTLAIGGGEATRRAAAGLKYYGHFDLPPGRYLLRALVREADSGRTGVTAARLEVPDFGAGGLAALPPLALDRPGRWVMLREPPPEGDDPQSVIYPFVVEGEPFVPAARPRLRGGEELRLCWVVYGAPAGEQRLEARLFDGERREVARPALAAPRRTATGIDGLDKWLTALATVGLAPGAYDLQLVLLDEEGTTVASASTPMVVD